jgi:hypothetical protein
MAEMIPIPDPNPLAEAKVDSLNELFNRDPFQMSDQDIAKIVDALRNARSKFKQDEATKPVKEPRAKKAKPSPLAQGSSAEDLATLLLGDL